MSTLIFRLRNVDIDEADAVRDLLAQHQIPFYETDAGNWGISMPGIWLYDDSDKPRARDLIDRYQAERRTQLQALDQAGPAARQSPQARLRRLALNTLFVAFSLFILYFSTMPFLKFLN